MSPRIKFLTKQFFYAKNHPFAISSLEIDYQNVGKMSNNKKQHKRLTKHPNRDAIIALDCGRLPKSPITEKIGHKECKYTCPKYHVLGS